MEEENILLLTLEEDSDAILEPDSVGVETTVTFGAEGIMSVQTKGGDKA